MSFSFVGQSCKVVHLLGKIKFAFVKSKLRVTPDDTGKPCQCYSHDFGFICEELETLKSQQRQGIGVFLKVGTPAFGMPVLNKPNLPATSLLVGWAEGRT
jgi:hypothetical protein